jgi:RNA polymerase sigma-70 factor (ECF subfamily)
MTIGRTAVERYVFLNRMFPAIPFVLARRGLRVNLREDLNALTPRLRRYARALMSGDPGGSDQADDLVHATLIRALASRSLGEHSELVVRLYATLTQMHRGLAGGGQVSPARTAASATAFGMRTGATPVSSMVRRSKLTTSLMGLALEDREALLLVVLEGFDHDEAARILRIPKAMLLTRLTRARTVLETQLQITGRLRPGFDHDRPQAPYLRLVK